MVAVELPVDAVHAPLLEAGATRVIGLDRDLDALAGARETLALATRREYAYHSVGALGVIELERRYWAGDPTGVLALAHAYERQSRRFVAPSRTP